MHSLASNSVLVDGERRSSKRARDLWCREIKKKDENKAKSLKV